MVAVENLAEYLLEQIRTHDVIRVPASKAEFLRTDQPNVWLNTDYRTLDDVAILGDLRLPLREVYHKIQFSSNL